MGKIVVIGTSPNPTRYSYKPVAALLRRNYELIAIGSRVGQTGGLDSIADRTDLYDDDIVKKT